jgi:hypothetical protein
MRHSLYLTLATLLIKADLRREEKQWQRKIRRSAYAIPWDNAHLLRDIGLDTDGRLLGKAAPSDQHATRITYRIRRHLGLRTPT